MHHYRNIFFFLGLLLYALFFTGYIVFSYEADKKKIIDTLDRDLYSSALTVPLILPENFHHKNMKADDYSKKESLKHIKKLSRFTQTSDIEYIYSLIKVGDTFHFTASSATAKELESSHKLSYYFDPYYDGNETFNKVLKDKKVVYGTLNDKWGSFRSVSIPMVSEDGQEFIVGADIRLDVLQERLDVSLEHLIYFILPIILLMFVYLMIGIYFHLRLEKVVEIRTLEISKLNITDTLTKYPNRKALLEHLDCGNDVHFSLLNINSFQVINDLYGNAVGDKLIIALSRLLATAIDKNDVEFFKLHGDEFAFVGSIKMRQFDFMLLMERVCSQVEAEEFIIEDNSIKVMVSVGVASLDKTPLLAASLALKQARKMNKSIYLYEHYLDISSELLHNQSVIYEIQDALEHNRVVPYFQAIYDVKQKKIVKYESLMRLGKSDGTLMLPGEFLEISYQAKLYDKLSKVMLDKVLEKAAEHPEIGFSFNLSAIDIENKSSSEQILYALKHAPNSHQLTIEILESEGFSSYQVVSQFIAQVKSYGVKVAIDDFGSGYSNFSEIIALDIDYLKIDGSLVKRVVDDEEYEHIIAAIIKLGHSLDLTIIAEFVENEAIALKLESMGVDMLQGYFISKPTPRCK